MPPGLVQRLLGHLQGARALPPLSAWPCRLTGACAAWHPTRRALHLRKVVISFWQLLLGRV